MLHSDTQGHACDSANEHQSARLLYNKPQLCCTSAKNAECREGSQAIVHNGSVSPADMPDEEQDADIDLLQWSSALDFDNYTR